MTLWSDLYGSRDLISRTFYKTPGTFTATAPAATAYLRVSLVGAGGWSSSNPTNRGGGSAFARKKLAATPGAQFSIQVGSIYENLITSGVSAPLADSIVTRVSDSVVIAKAAHGLGTSVPNKGTAANSIGDTVRDGGDGGGNGYNTTTGFSAGDDADPYPLGFGGAGITPAANNLSTIWAAPGVGGLYSSPLTPDSTATIYIPAGNGMVCVEWFNKDPPYS